MSWTNGNGKGGTNGNAGGNGNGNNQCKTNNGNGGGNNTSADVYEKDQYFFHPDHLGSSSYVTDADGEIFQHLRPFAALRRASLASGVQRQNRTFSPVLISRFTPLR